MRQTGRPHLLSPAAALLAVALLGCGPDGGVALEATATEPELAASPSPTAAPPDEAPDEASTTEAPPTSVVTDRWEQVPSLDGSPPAHESDIERAIDAALADPDFDGWLEWFETVTVTQIRTRGDGVLVRVDLHPHIDPAIPEQRQHGYPTAVCFVGRDSDVIASVVWLVDPGAGRVLASTPVWADGTSCHLW